jgi:predicted metal-binding membrane protein
MAQAALLERLLRRDRVITLIGLALLCVLAWVYTVSGAGMGMSAWQMTTFSLFPHGEMAPPIGGAPDAMPRMDMPGVAPVTPAGASGWGASTILLVVTMWWVMMIAMMSPSAAPTILLYARAYRHAVAQGQVNTQFAPTGAFAAGYLLVWLAFSVAAAAVQWLLVQTSLVSEIMMASQSRWLGGGLLIMAGLYQLSPLKGLCLEHCRSPTEFLTKNWRPGASGAVRLGILHGGYCVGCCWALMALLFVGGVMNLIWIAALSVVVLAEKIAPSGPWLWRGLGVALLLWGVATFVV